MSSKKTRKATRKEMNGGNSSVSSKGKTIGNPPTERLETVPTSTNASAVPSPTRAASDIGELRIAEVEALKKHIEDVVKRDVKRWAWRPIAVLLAIGGFFGITTWTSLRSAQKAVVGEFTEKARTDLDMKVKEFYTEKNVARVTEEVIRRDANDLIRKKVESEVDPIVRDLRAKQGEQSRVLEGFKRDQERYAGLTLLHDLTIRAEGGDLLALRGLANVAKYPQRDLSQAAVASIRRIHEVYFGQGNLIYRYYEANVSDSQVKERLRDDNFIARKLAVCTVRSRKMFDQIPLLIDQISVEHNLDVLAATQATLNELLGVKYMVLDDQAQVNYRNTWEQKKAALSGDH